MSGLAAHLLTWARTGFLLVVPTGFMMFTAHATRVRGEPASDQLILIVTALLNAAAFHRWPFRSVARWDVAAGTPTWARLAAVLSLVCWIGVIACGRLLAYF